MDVPRSTDQTSAPASGKETSAHTPQKKGFFEKIFAFLNRNREGEDGLLELMNAREESDTPLSAADKTLVAAALEFSRQTADDLSVPRADMVTLHVGFSYKEALETFTVSEHSRMPVIREDLDDIVGFITLKDLVGFQGQKKDFSLKALARPCTFVPANLSVMKVLEAMRHDKVQLAIVVDEYGGTAGIITLKDIIEALVGEMADEHETEAPQMLNMVSPHTYHIDPRLPIEELEETLQTSFPTFDSSGNPHSRDFETVGGLVLALAGRVPQEGEKFTTTGGHAFTVLEADGRRIKKIKLHTATYHPHVLD